MATALSYSRVRYQKLRNLSKFSKILRLQSSRCCQERGTFDINSLVSFNYSYEFITYQFNSRSLRCVSTFDTSWLTDNFPEFGSSVLSELSNIDPDLDVGKNLANPIELQRNMQARRLENISIQKLVLFKL